MSTSISVVIPYYYGKKYVPGLLRMMESNAEILRQEAEAALEVLIINDSPDEELEIRKPASFKLTVLANPENKGIHASRVRGLKEASGEYVLFLDQDDRITDNCLRSQLNHIGDADFVIGNGYDGEPENGKHLIFSDPAIQAAAADLHCHYYYNNLIRSPGQVLIRKTSVPREWTERILRNNGSDDAFLWILMLCKGCVAALNDDVVYEHTYTGENASSDNTAMLRSQLEVVEKLRDIASPCGMWAFIRRAKYYCTSGPVHILRYPDVGLARKMYSGRNLKVRRKG